PARQLILGVRLGYPAGNAWGVLCFRRRFHESAHVGSVDRRLFPIGHTGTARRPKEGGTRQTSRYLGDRRKYHGGERDPRNSAGGQALRYQRGPLQRILQRSGEAPSADAS